MKNTMLALIIMTMLTGVAFAGEAIVLKNENDRLSYSYGFKIGESLKHNEVTVNPEVLAKGLQDVVSGAKPLMTEEDMRSSLQRLQDKLRVAKYAERKKKAEEYRGEGRDFLAANAKKPGVVTLSSGLQYKVLKEGTGKSPGAHDSVTVNYRGTLINGQEFDSSYRKGKPATFRVDGVIKGWTEALQLMKKGAKWQLFIPPDLAYGERGALADRTLIFDVELISVN
jgi:FKBP-type peptidyl-prolyl cis-trans isomerase FklB